MFTELYKYIRTGEQYGAYIISTFKYFFITVSEAHGTLTKFYAYLKLPNTRRIPNRSCFDSLTQ